MNFRTSHPFLARIIHALLKIELLMSSVTPPVKDSLLNPIEQYDEQVASWKRHALQPNTLTISRSSHVVEIYVCKMLQGVNHELLQFKIQKPDGSFVWIACERAGGDGRSPSPSPSASSTNVNNISADTYTASGNSSSRLPARDRVIVSDLSNGENCFTGMAPYDLIDIFTLSENGPSLSVADLATLFAVINDYKPNYHILRTNCYWFAMVTLKTIQKKFTLVRNTSSSKTKLKAGRWGVLDFTHDKEEHLEVIQQRWFDQIKENAKLQSDEEVSVDSPAIL